MRIKDRRYLLYALQINIHLIQINLKVLIIGF